MEGRRGSVVNEGTVVKEDAAVFSHEGAMYGSAKAAKGRRLGDAQGDGDGGGPFIKSGNGLSVEGSIGIEDQGPGEKR